jgi:hypothetical protein
LRLQLWYSYFDTILSTTQESNDQNFSAAEKTQPNNQAVFRAIYHVTPRFSFDTMLRYVDSIQTYNIDSYFELDVRAAYKLSPNLELSISGVNLLQDSHEEYKANFVPIPAAEIQRSCCGRGMGRVALKARGGSRSRVPPGAPSPVRPRVSANPEPILGGAARRREVGMTCSAIFGPIET